MQLNPIFVSNIYDVYGDSGKLWIRELSTYIKQLSGLWDFRLINPMPSLSYNFVGLVKMNANGKSAILKMAPVRGKIDNEIKWLNCIDKGVPKIYADSRKHNAFLMEYLEPGNSLKNLVMEGQDDVATKVICQIIRNLQSQQHNNVSFQHLSELPKALSILKDRFDGRLLTQAETWFQELTFDRSQDVVLHGDLHHDNILSSAADWKAIDPHGYLGDPAAEVGVMIRNPVDGFPKNRALSDVVERRLKIIADELPFDRQKIKAWAFCMTLLSIAWTMEDHGKIKELEFEIAKAIDQVKM